MFVSRHNLSSLLLYECVIHRLHVVLSLVQGFVSNQSCSNESWMTRPVQIAQVRTDVSLGTEAGERKEAMHEQEANVEECGRFVMIPPIDHGHSLHSSHATHFNNSPDHYHGSAGGGLGCVVLTARST